MQDPSGCVLDCLEILVKVTLPKGFAVSRYRVSVLRVVRKPVSPNRQFYWCAATPRAIGFDLSGKAFPNGRETGGTRYDETSSKRRAGRIGGDAERCRPTRDVGKSEHAIVTRVYWVYRLGVAGSGVNSGAARQRLQSGDACDAHGRLHLHCALCLRFRDTEMGSLGSAAGAFAAIFLLQAASEAMRNDTFSHFALQVLGNWPERVLTTLFIFWLVGVLLSASRGKTRILWR